MIKKVIRVLRSSGEQGDRPDVVLHIGAPKAGSSAIQRFCQTHRGMLRKLGFHYPKHSMDKNGVSGGHAAMSMRLVDGDIDQARQQFNDWLAEARRKGLTLLLSAEALYGKHAALREMTEGLDVRVIGFLRDPIDYLLGNYNQGIKRRMTTHRVEREVDQILSGSTYPLAGLPFLAWADAFGDGNCIFLAYRSPKDGGDSIERTLLEVLGADPELVERLVPATEITNRSYVAPALELKRLLNLVLPGLPRRVALEVDWCLQGFSDRADHLRSYRASDLSDEVRTRLVDHFHQQMQPLIERFPELDRGNISSTSVTRHDLPGMSLNLAEPLACLAEEYPEALASIRRQAQVHRDQGRGGYSFFRLLEVLNVDFEEPRYLQCALSPFARQVIENEQSRGADFLREFSLVLERVGCRDEALLVMERALRERPNGRGIIQHLDRMKAGAES